MIFVDHFGLNVRKLGGHRFFHLAERHASLSEVFFVDLGKLIHRLHDVNVCH